MKTLFAALSPPDSIRAALKTYMGGVMGAKWRPLENLHITLSYYGSCTAQQEDELAEALGQIYLHGFEVHLKGVGHFGKDRPSALWMGVGPSQNLTDLHRACRRAGESIGLKLDTRNFTPHLTLAYLDRGAPLSDVMAYEKDHALLEFEPFRAHSFELYSSQNGPKQNLYVEEASYMLARG